MQFPNLTTDPAKDYGITFARQQYVASLAADHPDQEITDFDYAVKRIGSMVDSWALQADQAAATPPGGGDPGNVSSNWKPQAVADLEKYRKEMLNVLSSMLTYYQVKGETANASAVADVIDEVKEIDAAPGVVAALLADPGTRAAFDAAVVQRWQQIVVPTSAQLKVDFVKFGGNAV